MRAKSPQNLFLDFSAARYQEIIQIQKDKVITLLCEWIHSKVYSYSFFIFILLSSRKKDESERNVGVLSSKARTQVFFYYSMNSLRSNSISYLVAQPKVETRYNQKTCMLFSLFVRNADSLPVREYKCKG